MDLSRFSTRAFNRGASASKEALWMIISRVLFQWCPFCLSPVKRAVLRLFGAFVGKGVVIKPEVKITFPWKLRLGDHVWLGEECWLLNLAPIAVASHACISQRAFLCTGNHNYNSPTFDLITKPIQVGQGAWIGANTFVGPGVSVGSHAVLTAGSVATKDLEPCGVYQGNPAVLARQRRVTDNGKKLKP
jgi:putative colanic acid biosynthesis acetyltransferase WcaF